MEKGIYAFVLLSALLLAGCGGGSSGAPNAVNEAPLVDGVDPDPGATPEPSPDPTPEPSPDPTPEPSPDPTPEPKWSEVEYSSALFFGESHTTGGNSAAGVDYTDGQGHLLDEYNWPFILASMLPGSALVTNHAIPSQRLGWSADGAPYSVFNQIGNLVPGYGSVAPKTIVSIMAGWTSINGRTTSESFYYVARYAHEANLARLLIDHWSAVSHLGWSDVNNGGTTGGSDGFVTTAGESSSVKNNVDSLKSSFNPFDVGHADNSRWVTVLKGGQYSQITLADQRAAAVFLETDPFTEGVARIFVRNDDGGEFVEVRAVDCFWIGSDVHGVYSEDRYPIAVWLENLPANATIRVMSQAGADKSVRLLAIGYKAKPTAGSEDPVIIYGSPVGNTVNQHYEATLTRFGEDTERAVAAYSAYGVMYADVVSLWDEALHQEPQDKAHLTPEGNASVADAFINAKVPAAGSSENFIYLDL